jgi:hypothetical protein
MKCLLLIVLCAAPLVAGTEKRLVLPRSNTPVTIDGLIDPVWKTVDSVSDFFQLQPYYNQPPSRSTVAKLLTTPQAMYCLMICFDDRKNIQSNTGVLDQTNGDVVSLMLDTFGDRQTAYKFAVTASGVRADCRLLDDGRNRDYSWDGVWFADARVYDWGFVVEMEIPYKAIKYDAGLPEWGLDFDRWSPAGMEDLYWCSYEQNEGQRVSKFGRLSLNGFQPEAGGLNLEVYPVAITRAARLENGKTMVDPDAGIDIFYNPSEKLTYQLTINPDFAQIEADPFSFNISRYETYFSEQRPFFTQGNEVFMASGRSRNSGFYRPLELFYSRRIGRQLPDGSEVPLVAGTKAFGRLGDWEYGGFLALTGEQDYLDDEERRTESRAVFGSGRIKKQIFDNSTIGVLFVGKQAGRDTYGVLDIDGAFRTSTWQLAYQVARSIENASGDIAGSAGLTMLTRDWINNVRVRGIGKNFDVRQVGYVPWQGTVEFGAISGPVWFFDQGSLSQMLLYAGPFLYYEDADAYTDYAGLLGLNMEFRSKWGFELNLSAGKSRDEGVQYNSYETSLSSWFNVSPAWNANAWGGYSRTYNFSREYLAFYSYGGFSVGWTPATYLQVGTSYDMYIEGNPEGGVEDITYNARPFVSISPVNHVKIRVYVDNVFRRSTDRLERVLGGLLFSYNFLPKSWVYFAVNEVRERQEGADALGNTLPARMQVTDRVAVAKVKYLYYF